MTNALRTILLVASTCALAANAGVAEEFSYPSTMTIEQVRARIDDCDVSHPRLLAHAEELAHLKRFVDQDPLAKALGQGIVRQADILLDVPPITRTLTGRRLLGQSRRCVQRLLTLSMAYHLSGNQKYVRRAEKEMLAVSGFPDWNPSHFLDVAEMTFAMAVGYDWLYDQLPEESRGTIRKAIIQKGVSLPFTSRHKGWVRARNNWGQVCHGGLTAGALAILEDDPELAAKTVHQALHNVRYAMDAYAPHGSYPEGPGYWVYGTSYNVLLIAVLESALGSDFGLTKAPGFNLTGQFPALTCGPSGQYFNYSDGGSGRSADPILYWLAHRFRRPDWLLGENERLQRVVADVNARPRGSYGSRFMPLALLWMHHDSAASEIQMPLHWSSEGGVPITIHRTSWTDRNATFVGFKGGSPAANHGQMDIGSFVLDAGGVRWAIDLGAEGYHGIESRGMNLWDRRQSSDRWTIFRQSNAGHNTLVIDGQLQRVTGRAQFVDFSADPAFPHSVLDMSSVYQGQADSVLRGIALLPSGQVLVRDELKGLKPGVTVRWGMITPATLDRVDGDLVHLKQGDATMKMQIIAPAGATWTEIDTATPRHEWDSPNRGTRMIAVEHTASASGELTLLVLATSGSCQQPVKERLDVRPLDKW